MIPCLRQTVAALLVLLLPALSAAPRGDVCAHGRSDTAAAEVFAHHTHADRAATTADSQQHQHDTPDCPMDSGQAGCTTQAPLPVRAASTAAVAALTALPPRAATLQPAEKDPASIFHPPRV